MPSSPDSPAPAPFPIGLLAGHGIGPEIAAAAATVAQALARLQGFALDLQEIPSPENLDTRPTVAACRKIHSAGGRILAGPLREPSWSALKSALGLAVRLNPILPCPDLAQAGPLQIRSGFLHELLVVHGPALCLEPAARLAATRRGLLAVAARDEAWREPSREWAAAHGIELRLLDPAFAAARLLSHPKEFDVLVAPEPVGETLASLGCLLMGGRALGFGFSRSPDGLGFFQPNHGTADDLAGSGLSDPCGLLFALAALMEDAGRPACANLLRNAIRRAWKHGWRTTDVAAPGLRTLGTDAMAAKIIASLEATE